MQVVEGLCLSFFLLFLSLTKKRLYSEVFIHQTSLPGYDRWYGLTTLCIFFFFFLYPVVNVQSQESATKRVIDKLMLIFNLIFDLQAQ